jgi:hypothetical protein
MIRGIHNLIYSENPEADRAFLRDVLGFPCIDAHDGWLIFALPKRHAARRLADQPLMTSPCEQSG